MKRLLSVILMVIIMVGITGCTVTANVPEGTPNSTAVEAVVELTPTATPELNIEPLRDAVVQIDENNSMQVSIYLEDTETHGLGMVKFSGEDITTEYEYIAATMYCFSQLGISDYSIAGTSGEDTIGIMIIDGEAAYINLMPDKYKAIKPDDERVLEYVKTMAAALSENQ